MMVVMINMMMKFKQVMNNKFLENLTKFCNIMMKMMTKKILLQDDDGGDDQHDDEI